MFLKLKVNEKQVTLPVIDFVNGAIAVKVPKSGKVVFIDLNACSWKRKLYYYLLIKMLSLQYKSRPVTLSTSLLNHIYGEVVNSVQKTK